MLRYIASFHTGVPEDVINVPVRSYYFYETSTGVVYVHCTYIHNFNIVDHTAPLVKPDGTFLTYPEWIATQDEWKEERERECECDHCKSCGHHLDFDSEC